MKDHGEFIRMPGVDAVPPCGDLQNRCLEKRFQVTQDQLVDLKLIERLDGITILVRIAQSQFAGLVL